ncbi:hypothetical protein ScPMuIL_016540 [Solemya velum]
MSEYRYPLMHWASALGKVELVKYLISIGFSASCRKRETGDTALHRALLCLQQTCHKDSAKKFREILVVLPSMLMMKNGRGNTPLHTCCYYLHKEMPKVDYYTECVSLIINQATEGGGDFLKKLVNCQNNDGSTAIHILAQHDRNFPVLKLLLDEGKADMTITTNKNLSPLDVAINDGSMKISNYLNGLKEGTVTRGKTPSPNGKKNSLASECPPSKKLKLQLEDASQEEPRDNAGKTQLSDSSPSQKCTDAESIQNESETITELPSKAFTLVNNEETQSAMPSDKSTSSTLRHQATSILRSTTRISTRNTWSPTFPKTPVIENKSSNCVTDKSTPVTTKNSVVASKNSLQDKVTPLVKETVLSGTILSTKRNSLGTITTTDIKIFPTSGSTATNNGFPTSSSNVEKDAGDSFKLSEDASEVITENSSREGKHNWTEAKPSGSSLLAYLKICDLGTKNSIKETLLNDQMECTRKIKHHKNARTEIESSIGKKTSETETKQRQLRVLLLEVDDLQKDIQVLVSQTKHLHHTLLQKEEAQKTMESKLETVNLALKDLNSV